MRESCNFEISILFPRVHAIAGISHENTAAGDWVEGPPRSSLPPKRSDGRLPRKPQRSHTLKPQESRSAAAFPTFLRKKSTTASRPLFSRRSAIDLLDVRKAY